MPSISARLSEEEAEELERVCELLGADRGTVVRKALSEGLRDLRVQRAVERYRMGEASVTQAARIAGVSLGEWLEVARDRDLVTQLTPADLERDAETALEL